MISQKDAVFNSIMMVLNESDIVIPESGVKSIWTKDVKIAVAEIIKVGIEAGDIPFKGQASGVDRYVTGLISNWINKDPRLNGQKKYKTTTKATGNASLDEAMKLYGVVKGTFLEQRVKATISSMKGKQSIDVEHLPLSLRELVK